MAASGPLGRRRLLRASDSLTASGRPRHDSDPHLFETLDRPASHDFRHPDARSISGAPPRLAFFSSVAITAPPFLVENPEVDEFPTVVGLYGEAHFLFASQNGGSAVKARERVASGSAACEPLTLLETSAYTNRANPRCSFGEAVLGQCESAGPCFFGREPL